MFNSSSGIAYSDESSIPLTLLISPSIIVICAQLLLPNSIAILKCYSYPHWHKLLDPVAMERRSIPGAFQLTNLRKFFEFYWSYLNTLLLAAWYLFCYFLNQSALLLCVNIFLAFSRSEFSIFLPLSGITFSESDFPSN